MYEKDVFCKKSAPKKAHSAKKNPKGGHFGPLYFWKHKKALWFSAKDPQTFAKPWDPNYRVRNESPDNSSIDSINLFWIFPPFSTKAIVYQVATVI